VRPNICRLIILRVDAFRSAVVVRERERGGGGQVAEVAARLTALGIR
jgi:hypothetical protein